MVPLETCVRLLKGSVRLPVSSATRLSSIDPTPRDNFPTSNSGLGHHTPSAYRNAKEPPDNGGHCHRQAASKCHAQRRTATWRAAEMAPKCTEGSEADQGQRRDYGDVPGWR